MKLRGIMAFIQSEWSIASLRNRQDLYGMQHIGN